MPVYIFAQLMGAITGALIVYANYINAIDVVEGGRHIRTVPGTANLFSTYAVSVVVWIVEVVRIFIVFCDLVAVYDIRYASCLCIRPQLSI